MISSVAMQDTEKRTEVPLLKGMMRIALLERS